MIKKCRVCGCEKDISCFVKNKHCLSGYENICKQCKNERMKVYKKTPKYKAYRKSYYQKYKNKEKANIKNRQNRNPLLCRSKLLYAGMRDRARGKGIDFDKEHFSVKYICERLSQNPYCECCKKRLDRIDMESNFTKAIPQKIMASDSNPNGTHLYIEQRAYIARELEEQGYGNVKQGVKEFADYAMQIIVKQFSETEIEKIKTVGALQLLYNKIEKLYGDKV